jgi:hypothetical protein
VKKAATDHINRQMHGFSPVPMGDSDPEISENETDPEPDEKADKDFPPLKKKSSSRTTTR